MYLFTLVAASLFLSGCGATSNTPSNSEDSPAASGSPSGQSEFAWKTDLLYQAMLDDQLVDSWGYKIGDGKSAIDEFAIDSNNLINDTISGIKPSTCETAANLFLARAELQGELYSHFEHWDTSDFLKSKMFISDTYTFKSTAEAQSTFDKFKASLTECSTFNYLVGSEVNSLKIWDQPSINEATRIIGNNGKSQANAVVISGSAISVIQVFNSESIDDAQAIADKGSSEIQTKLNAVQGN